jgi:hypothetical protein
MEVRAPVYEFADDNIPAKIGPSHLEDLPPCWFFRF